MSNKVKDTNRKNRKYYFFNIINIESFDPNNIKMDEKFLLTILDMWWSKDT